VLSHAGADLGRLASLVATTEADILVAGGITSLEQIAGLRDAGVRGVLLGEVLFTGAIELAAAIRAAA
jgi:phosphoribosylformimino-5-aminoimidazole carboxamide ribotide isomerase